MTYDRKMADGPQLQSVTRPKPAPATHSPTADQVIAMQQSAGNSAVSRQLGQQPAPQTVTLQLAAMWNDMVLMPITRAYGLLGADKPDLERASRELEFASRGIKAVKAGTPANDPNLASIRVLETRVDGLMALVAQQRGRGKSDFELEKDMIDRRLEAETLGPKLAGTPPSTSTDPSAPVPTSASADTSASPKSPAATTSQPSSEWHDDVVANLWEGHKAFAQDNAEGARTYFLIAQITLLHYVIDTPVGDPNRVDLINLYQGVISIADIISNKATGTSGRDGLQQAADAYIFAEQIGKYLAGQPADDTELEEDAPSAPGEPAFTWESGDKKPFVNDTELLRP